MKCRQCKVCIRRLVDRLQRQTLLADRATVSSKFAIKVTSGGKNSDDSYVYSRVHREKGETQPRMINVVPTGGKPLSRTVHQAVHDCGAMLEAISSNDLPSEYKDLFSESDRSSELTTVRHWIANQLDPGCRICLGGKNKGIEGDERGVIEEVKLALLELNSIHRD